MNTVLLPNREQEAFDASKCYVTLIQIDNMISDYENKLASLHEKYDQSGKDDQKRIGDMIFRAEGQVSVLKDVRHMAYVTRGYRKED